MEFSGFVNPWLCPLHGCQGTRASSLPTALEPGRTFIDASVPGILNYLFCQWEASHAAVAQCMSTAQDQEKSQIERDKLWELIQVSKTREQRLQIISKPSTGSHPTACSAAQGHPQGINRSFVPLTLIGAPRLCDQVQRQWLGKVSPRYSSELSTERERESPLHSGAKSSHFCTFFFAPTCSLLKGYGDTAQCCTTLCFGF